MKQLLILPLIMLFFAVNSISAVNDSIDPGLPMLKIPIVPGGDVAFLRYITENVKYPVSAFEMGTQGRIGCRFTVRKDGSVGNVRIQNFSILNICNPLESFTMNDTLALKNKKIEYEALTSEAIRVVCSFLDSFPKWTYDDRYGTYVDIDYSVPVRFSLSKHGTTYELGKTSVSDVMKEHFPFEKPLIILDGKEIAVESIKDVEDVFNISILKYNEAIELYGDRGKNGVFIIRIKDRWCRNLN